ncbi:SAM-dependent methyltransferase [Mycolicibacter senuensis]|nr:SAM-dependent methyltransferase [Mycolicibacter senuensis]
MGYTALGVAAMRALATALPQPLARDDYAEAFVRASGEPYLVGLLGESAGHPDGSTSNWPEFFGVQMRFFDSFFSAACADGVRQAVILAAGLDARAYRLQWPTGTTVYEVDQPEVLAFKSQVLNRRGAQPRAERYEVAIDMRDDWIGALTSAGFNPGAPTAWLVEGLLMYLPGEAHDTLFELIDSHSAPGSRLGTHVFESTGDDSPVGILPLGQELNPFADIDIAGLVYEDDRLDPPEWLTDRRWRVSTATASELSQQYGKPLSGISAELDRVASKASYLSAVR